MREAIPPKTDNIQPDRKIYQFDSPPSKKSLLVAYICTYFTQFNLDSYLIGPALSSGWLFGGVFGLHHLYLHRDRQAFVWWSTLGGYFFVGWLHDALQIPSLVREANLDPKFVEEFVLKLQRFRKPPFTINRFLGSFLVSYVWGQVVLMAIPTDEVNGINFMHFHWFIPAAIALGVWTVGNIGRESGKLWPCLVVSYLVYIIRFWIYDETVWFSATVFCSALAFEIFSKQWRIAPPRRRSKKVRACYLVPAIITFSLVLSACFYMNVNVKNADGEDVPIYEAMQNFLNSPMWTDLKQSLDETWKFAQHNGWYETWKQIVELMDVDGEKNAYKVLDLSPTSTQSEVTAKWRKLSRENHPDKVKEESLRRVAQEKFMEIQQAYEILSKAKNKRMQRNQQYKDDL